jgi:hypothetical protein
VALLAGIAAVLILGWLLRPLIERRPPEPEVYIIFDWEDDRELLAALTMQLQYEEMRRM